MERHTVTKTDGDAGRDRSTPRAAARASTSLSCCGSGRLDEASITAVG
jgi:hypothetical protein